MRFTVFLITFFTFVNLTQAKFKFAPEGLEYYSQLQFTWWGFKVYRAEVWTPSSNKPDFNKNLILHINYQRDIKAKSLVSTTRDEWERLKLLRPESERWLKELSVIWPDIKSGDSLTTFSNGQKTFFYQGPKLLGSINDKNFATVFLKIWLHENSKTSELLKRKK